MIPYNYNFQAMSTINPLLYTPLINTLHESALNYCPAVIGFVEDNSIVEDSYVPNTSLEALPQWENLINDFSNEEMTLKGTQLLAEVQKKIEQIFNKNLLSEVVTNSYAKVLDINNFNNVKVGDWVFFCHINKLTHLAISKLQTYMKMDSKLFPNVTHVGVITKIISNKIIQIAEAAGNGLPIQENTYNVDELHNDEDVIIIPPPQPIIAKKVKDLGQIMQVVGRSWISKPFDNSNHYNLEGLLKVPTLENGFSAQDKTSMVESFVDYVFFKSPPQIEKDGVLKDKPYFCSEFAQEVAQFSRFLQLSSINPKKIEKEIAEMHLDVHTKDGRAQIVKYLSDKWNQADMWNVLLKDPLFSIPARKATPGTLLELALRYSSAVRINTFAKERYEVTTLSKDSIIDYVEYLGTKLLERHLNGEKISKHDPNVKKLLMVMETEMHYSKETLDCFMEQCFDSDDFSACAEICLQKTLTLPEQIKVFFVSREVNRAITKILQNTQIVEFLNDPYDEKWRNPAVIDNLKFTIEDIVNTCFPLTDMNLLTNIENLFAQYMFNSFDTMELFKYIPIGLGYDSPSPIINDFMERENINKEKFMKHAFYLFKLIQQNNNSNEHANKNMQIIYKILADHEELFTKMIGNNELMDMLKL